MIGTALALSPGIIGGHYEIGVALLLKGQPKNALESFQMEEDEEYRAKGKAMAFHDLGREDEFTVAFNELRERWGEQWPPEIAHVYAWIGDADSAFKWLEKQYQDSGTGAWGEIASDTLFTNNNDDPRWLPFLEKIGKSPAQLAAIKFNVTLPK